MNSSAPADLVARKRQVVLDSIDAAGPEMVDSLLAAIGIPSVNPKYPGQDYAKVAGAEGGMSDLMADLYRSAGAEVEMVQTEPGRGTQAPASPGTDPAGLWR